MKVLMTDNSNGYEISMVKAENGRYVILVENEDGLFDVRFSTMCRGTVDSRYFRLVRCGR